MTGALVVLPTRIVRVLADGGCLVIVLQNFLHEAIIARSDKATLADGWIVPPGRCVAIPEAVLDRARAAVDAGDAFQLVGHDGDAVDQAADHLRRLLRIEVAL